ncbi:alpha/beta fold hydrolase [Parenemella sanctibonifatiensis]|uniref:Alpha/beta hydrolase n=1 Tax=Parenemella sanctibonifatiensis TaxID=2016505 RepID=A0A255E8R8_9ACTN|nr:alpha/beta hydrolase [Parenemella sanctibonifatiensis]OYN87906.1 alpha/beta hydrolase [Parenemella sanctibonifatiensis]
MTDLHVIDEGPRDGSPVVLIHGWPASAEMWAPQRAALVAAGHRVISYDRRGFGRSEKPALNPDGSGYDYDTLADDLAQVLQAYDVEKATLVGFSMGGGEVARYLSRHGMGRVAKAVLLGAVPPCLHHSEDNPTGPMDDEAIAGMQDGVRADREGFMEDFSRTFYGVDDELAVDETTRQLLLSWAAEADLTAMVECVASFSRTDFRRDLAAFSLPTLIVHGDADAIVPLEVSAQLAHEQIPGSRLVVIEGAPHGLTASHAGEVNAALLDFLAN